MKAALLGPYELSFEAISAALPGSRAGVFALGHVDNAGRFRIERIGRDDEDLAQRLRSLIGSSNRFKYSPRSSPREAFEAECILFHQFRPPGNLIHPARPKASSWTCPVCRGGPF